MGGRGELDHRAVVRRRIVQGGAQAPARRSRPRRRRPPPVQAPPPRGGRELWHGLARGVVALLPEFSSLAAPLERLSWSEQAALDPLRRAESAVVEVGPARLELSLVTELCDSSAGPVASSQRETLTLLFGGEPRVTLCRTPPGSPRLVQGPPGLATQLGLATAADGA